MSYSSAFIKIDKLTKIYHMGKIQVTALKDVTFSFEEGRFIVISGASGSGKSTLLNLLAGLDTPTSGNIEVNQKKISQMNKLDLALYRRHSVGMIFQSFNLLPSRSALENVEFPLIFAGVAKKERRPKAEFLLDKVGLYSRRSHKPAELSGGEQQRVAIARALINKPQVLLADEPTGNLDSSTSRDIIEFMSNLNRKEGLTVVMVSHEEALAREFSDEMIRLHDGQVKMREKIR